MESYTSVCSITSRWPPLGPKWSPAVPYASSGSSSTTAEKSWMLSYSRRLGSHLRMGLALKLTAYEVGLCEQLAR